MAEAEGLKMERSNLYNKDLVFFVMVLFVGANVKISIHSDESVFRNTINLVFDGTDS